MVSNTTASPSISTGTSPVGACFSISALVFGITIGMTTSSKESPICFIAIQGLSDHEE
jgi:hypothetical protein